MKESKTVKGYKAFKPGFYCEHDGNRKQYYENSIAEDEGANACCEKGVMHFCKNPLDTLDYYPLINDDGKLTEFAPVVALDKVYTNGNKCATKRLEIGVKFNVFKLGEFAAKYIKEECKSETETEIGGNRAKQVGGNRAQQVGGDWAKQAGGNRAQQVGGDWAQQVGGDWAQQVGGDSAQQVGGNRAQQVGGNRAQQESGANSVIMAGPNSLFKTGIHSVVLHYWYDDDMNIGGFKAAQVDGKTLKPDTWYKLENGEFVEVQNEN